MRRQSIWNLQSLDGQGPSCFHISLPENGASICPGIVPVTDGKVGKYIYGDYVNELKNTEWKLVEQTLKAAEDGTYCFVIMNSGKPGGDILIDDFTVTFGSTAIIK